ncbi:MAG: 1-acyl-sn-glycerol-3-phosphate acyltransferase [Betaproteobacteria bacterium]|jgi:1-acyl-sn-glycerol-3-phosphate acyltransferase
MAVPLKGSAWAQALLRLFGWRVVCPGMPARQGVMIAWPHTSNWDFPVAMLARAAVGLPLAWWAKESLFRWPVFGAWIRALGARPLVRDRGPQGVVGLMSAELRAAKAEDRFLWMGLSPEGTRRLTEGWRSGFYRVALQADVPVALALLDFGRREVRLEHAWRLSGDAQADLAAMAAVCEGTRGCKHDKAAPVRLLEK